MKEKSEIFIITGTPGSGKSIVAKHLLQRYEFGIHIPIDDLREWVVSGIAHPLPTWTEETTRQFDLGFRATANVASLYADAGFTVAIDQVIYPEDAKKYLAKKFSGHKVYKIFLKPEVDIALKRNAQRTNKEFEPSVLHEPIKGIYKSLAEAIEKEKDWIIIDSSNLSLEKTVDEILRRIKPE